MVLDSLYLELIELIKTDLPALLPEGSENVKHFDLWAEQTEYLEEGSNMPFNLPAVFFEFITDEIENIGSLSRNWPVMVTCYVADFSLAESFDGSNDQEQALNYLKRLGILDSLLHGSTIDSGTLNSVGVRRYKTGTNLHIYTLTYGIEIIDESSAEIHLPMTNGPSSITPVKGEPTIQTPGNSFGDGYFVDL